MRTFFFSFLGLFCLLFPGGTSADSKTAERIAHTPIAPRSGLVSQFTTSPFAAIFCRNHGTELEVVEKLGTLSSLDLNSSRWKGEAPHYSAHVGPLQDRILSPDGAWALDPKWSARVNDKPIIDRFSIWNLRDGRSLGEVPAGELTFSANARFLFWSQVGAEKKGGLQQRVPRTDLHVVDFISGNHKRHELVDAVEFLTLDRQGKRAAYYQPDDHAVIVYDLERAVQIFSRSFSPGQSPPYVHLAFSERGDKLSMLLQRNDLDFHSKLELYSLNQITPLVDVSVEHPLEISGMKREYKIIQSLAPSEDYLVVFPDRGRMLWIDALTGDELRTVFFDPEYVSQKVTFCMGDSKIVTQDAFGRAAVWDLERTVAPPLRNDFASLWEDLADTRRGFSAMRLLGNLPEYRNRLRGAMDEERAPRDVVRSWDGVREEMDRQISLLGRSFYVRNAASRALERQVLNLPDSMARRAQIYLRRTMASPQEVEVLNRLQHLMNTTVTSRVRGLDRVSMRITRAERALARMAAARR